MRLRLGVMTTLLIASIMFFSVGCDNTTNEEGLDKSKTAAGEAKTYKSYGDYALEKAEKIKKENEAAKEKAGKTKKP
jgi:hypothetical protein